MLKPRHSNEVCLPDSACALSSDLRCQRPVSKRASFLSIRPALLAVAIGLPLSTPLAVSAQGSSILAGRPITVAVRKVKDQANASWWKPSFEEKLADVLSTELTNSGHFTVLERDNEAMKELQKELNLAGVNKKTAAKKNNITGAKYVIIASLTDFQEAGSKGGGNSIGFGGFGFGNKKETREFYVSFDLKVINTSTAAVAFSRTIEGSAKEEKSGSAFSGGYGGLSVGKSEESETKLPVGRAIRAAMVESAQYLDCVLYQKDQCVAEYKAKDEKRKESTKGTLDMF
jgi:curli biogenesis system outer membrane secretion channel CsgG